jgi:uncharacterized protein
MHRALMSLFNSQGHGGVRLRAVGLLLGVAFAAAALGCESVTTVSTSPDPGGIAVNGIGTVTVVPDVAVLSIGVEAGGATVAVSRQSAASALEAVRASLKRNGVDDKDIKTHGLSIRPEYSSRPTSTPVIIGYVTTNTVSVKVRKLDTASKVLDDAVEAGGDVTRVNGISFEVDKPERYQAQARELAMKDARDRAEALAANAGVKLGRPRSISESFGGPIPFGAPQMAEARGLGDTPTPINPGESEVVINVNVTFAIE